MTRSKEREVDTQLAIIIDPPKQTPGQAVSRTSQFLENGGRAVLIGGSGEIEKNLFHDTISAVTEITETDSVPVWILPGHIGQIPLSNRGFSEGGVLNFRDIMGSGGKDFDSAYPSEARQYVLATLAKRQIASIPTLYVLCGNPEASVSKVSGISPLDLASLDHRQRFYRGLTDWLNKGVDCVFFEAGSGSSQHVNEDVVRQTRQEISSLSPDVLLFASGGIKQPAQVSLFAGVADYVVMGGYFEINGADHTRDFVNALKDQP